MAQGLLGVRVMLHEQLRDCEWPDLSDSVRSPRLRCGGETAGGLWKECDPDGVLCSTANGTSRCVTSQRLAAQSWTGHSTSLHLNCPPL